MKVPSAMNLPTNTPSKKKKYPERFAKCRRRRRNGDRRGRKGQFQPDFAGATPVFEKRLHTTLVRHSHDSRVTLHCVACARVIERVPVCAVCSCASGVLCALLRCTPSFLRTGSLRCHWRPRPHTGHTHPKGSDSLCPVRSNPSGRGTHGIPSRLLSPGAHTLFLGRTSKESSTRVQAA